jgi:hypothetical protein
MIGRNSSFGIAVLCGLAVCAVAAGNASAAQKAFTCSPTAASKTFSDAHCLSAGGTNFGHVAIAETTSVEATNANTASATTAAQPWKLEGFDAGINTLIECTTASGTGSLTNQAAFVEGTGFLHFTGCVVLIPINSGCVVKEGKVDTEELSATTNGQPANKLKVQPVAGAKLAGVTIESCKVAGLNNTTPLTGSLVADTSGATVTTTIAGVLGQKTLKYAGANAGVEGALTFKKSGGGNPITLT